MTGTVKFGGNEGTANSFLVANYKGTGTHHPVEDSKNSYVTSILSKVKPDVKFKSTAEKPKDVKTGKETKTGFYRFWSVVGLGYNATEKAQKKATPENNSVIYDSELLNDSYDLLSVVNLGYDMALKATEEMNEAYDLYNSGELLTEGFFDKLKKIWNKFKTWLANLLKKVKEWVSSSVENMMNFLGLKPDIKFNNEIIW